MASDTRRIAVVDDDPLVLRGLRRVLRSAGFEVDTYELGVAFLMAYETTDGKLAKGPAVSTQPTSIL